MLLFCLWIFWFVIAVILSLSPAEQCELEIAGCWFHIDHLHPCCSVLTGDQHYHYLRVACLTYRFQARKCVRSGSLDNCVLESLKSVHHRLSFSICIYVPNRLQFWDELFFVCLIKTTISVDFFFLTINNIKTKTYIAPIDFLPKLIKSKESHLNEFYLKFCL